MQVLTYVISVGHTYPKVTMHKSQIVVVDDDLSGFLSNLFLGGRTRPSFRLDTGNTVQVHSSCLIHISWCVDLTPCSDSAYEHERAVKLRMKRAEGRLWVA